MAAPDSANRATSTKWYVEVVGSAPNRPSASTLYGIPGAANAHTAPCSSPMTTQIPSIVRIARFMPDSLRPTAP